MLLNRTLRFHLTLAAAVLAMMAAPAQAQTGETITGMAQITSGGASAQTPFTLKLERFATDAEQAALVKAVKAEGTEAARKMLAGRAAAGTLQIGKDTTQVKYAFVRSLGSGRLITAITTDPITASSVSPTTTAKTSDLGFVLVQVSPGGKGTGELIPAGRARVDEKGAIVTEATNPATVVRLTDVVGK